MLDIKNRLKKFFDNEKVSTFIDTIKFILIHGVMGLFSLLIVVSTIGIDFSIVNIIRASPMKTVVVFLLGSGSLYYLFLDINKFLQETWSKKR